MKQQDVIAALGALAQDSRLEVFRLLVRTGKDGLAAGQSATAQLRSTAAPLRGQMHKILRPAQGGK